MIDSTTKLQVLLNTGKPIPKGTYWIDGIVGLAPRGGLLNLDGVELRAIPQVSPNYNIIRVDGVKDLTIKGGRIIGERKEHKGTGGEFGYGIRLMGNSARITIDGVYIADCWGDGILISGGAKDVVDSPTIRNCTIYNNRRQGISVGQCKNLRITNNKITYTGGTPPECGIDVEPWTGEVVQGVSITGNTITDNRGSAVVLSAARGKILAPISVTGNVMARNKNRLPYLRVNKLPRGDSWFTDVMAAFGVYRKEYVA
jgi:parallel beta-helix repeat protein